MWVSCILRSGLLFVTLSLAIAKHKQSSFAESCYPVGTLSQAVDTLYVKAASLRATIPKNCRFQEQLLSFFMEDVFGQLQLQVCKETHFVEDFHSLRQKLSRCVSIYEIFLLLIFLLYLQMGKKGIYKAISELDILLSWIKQFLESI
ncbi:hypothetical protein MJG53_020526, partial [Ovis ammon polii x Ovis aries]